MSSDSEMNNYIVSLQLVEKYLFQYVAPVIMAVGLISCVLNWIVFNRRTLRHSPCSIYMTAFYTVNFTYIITLMIAAILSVGYNVTFIPTSRDLCRLFIYMAYVFDILNPSCLILASFDRLLITSPNALTRQRSTCRLAYISVVCVITVWLLFHIHALILTEVIQLGPNVIICASFNPAYLTGIGYYSLVKSIVIPSLLVGLSAMAVKNVQKLVRNRVAPDASTNTTGNNRNVQRIHHKDRQLVLILLSDIAIYVLCVYPQAGYNVYSQITQYHMKTIDQLQIDTFIQFLTAFIGFIPYCSGLYTNLLVSKTFRSEVKSIILCK